MVLALTSSSPLDSSVAISGGRRSSSSGVGFAAGLRSASRFGLGLRVKRLPDNVLAGGASESPPAFPSTFSSCCRDLLTDAEMPSTRPLV